MIYFPEYCYEHEGTFFTPYVHCGKWGMSVRGKNIQTGKEIQVSGTDSSIEYVGRLCKIPEEDILMLKLTYSS